MVRNEVHDHVNRAFGVKEVHSEYGMTELLSQAYHRAKGFSDARPGCVFLPADPYDPVHHSSLRENSALNIIDLANLHSCALSKPMIWA